jgi:hypothetical protein
MRAALLGGAAGDDAAKERRPTRSSRRLQARAAPRRSVELAEAGHPRRHAVARVEAEEHVLRAIEAVLDDIVGGPRPSRPRHAARRPGHTGAQANSRPLPSAGQARAVAAQGEALGLAGGPTGTATPRRAAVTIAPRAAQVRPGRGGATYPSRVPRRRKSKRRTPPAHEAVMRCRRWPGARPGLTQHEADGTRGVGAHESDRLLLVTGRGWP